MTINWGTTEGVPAEMALTVIDYVARLESFGNTEALAAYAGALPVAVVEDERFAKALKRRLDEIKRRSRSA